MTFPERLEYTAKINWDHQSGGDVYIRNHPALSIDMPTVFGGRGTAPCPDELFLTAIGGCYLTTFLYFQRVIKFRILELNVSVRGTVEYLGPDGYHMPEVTVSIHIDVEEADKTKAAECATLTKKYCHLSRSILNGITIKVDDDVNPTL